MAVTIAPANPSDVGRLAEIQRLAFGPSRIQQLIFGQVTPADADASSSARLLKAIADPLQAVWKAEKDGKIVGFALWGVPHAYKEEPEVEETEEERVERLQKRFPVGSDYELADSFFGSLDLGIKTPHYHLGVLVVDPSVQRTGAGAALLRWGCTQADKEGVDAYLEASDVGVPLYQKAGFKLIREPIRGGCDNSMVLYPMHRPPLLLTRATSSQLPVIAAIHRTAFFPTLWFNSLWGNCSAKVFDAWFVEKGRRWLEGETKGEHFVVAMRGEDVLGYALWEEKEGPEEGEVAAEKDWPEGTNVEVADGFNRDMHKYTSTIRGRYWHLHFLATSPLFQRSGAGKALIQWGIDRAKKVGLSVYLEGGSEALPLYQKMGFVICGAPVAGIDGSFADTPVVLHPVVVAPAQPEDLHALAGLHRAAFEGAPHKLVMFPDVKDEDYQAWNVARMSKWLAPENEGKHWTVVAKRGGVILGFGHYVLDERVEGAEVEKPELPSFPKGTDVEAAKYLFEVIGNSEKEIRGKYIMLHQLATNPLHQKTGAGRALLQWGINLTQGMGLDLYLDATPPGRRLYDSMGFKQWAPSLSAWGSVETYPMVLRSPSPSTTLPPLTLNPAHPSEISHLATLFREAFSPTAIYQAMFHSCPSSSYDAWNVVRLTRWLANEGRGHWTVVARRGEQVVGFGHWERHAGKGAEEEEEEEESVPLPEGTDKEKGPRIFDALHKASEEIEGPFIMLHQLAIDPSLQRTGAGRALTQSCIDFAQRQDPPLDLYLDSTEYGRPLYDKMGFVQWDETTTVGEGWPKTFPLVYRAIKST